MAGVERLHPHGAHPITVSGDGVGKRASQLPAGADAELVEHVAQVPLNGARAEEQPGADLRIRQTIAGEARDLPLLCGQIIAESPPPGLRTLSPVASKLTACAFGERLHADRREHLVRRVQLLSGVGARFSRRSHSP